MKNLMILLTLSMLTVVFTTEAHARGRKFKRAVRKQRMQRPVKRQKMRRARVNQRQTRQAKRIKNGIQNGELTRGEAKQLRRQQKRIRKAEKFAKADGVVTKREAKRLQKMQNRASKNIYKKKHNDKQRGEFKKPVDNPSVDTPVEEIL